MKKVTSLMLCLFILLLCLSPQINAAEPEIKLFYNGKQLAPTVEPKIIEGTTFVPLRIIAEELGSMVSWVSSERKVEVEKEGTRLELFVDQTVAMVNGEEENISNPPIIMDGRTLLPLRFVSEQFGALVYWDGKTKTVSIYKEEPKAIVADEMPPILVASQSETPLHPITPPKEASDVAGAEEPLTEEALESSNEVEIESEDMTEAENAFVILSSVETIGDQMVLQLNDNVKPTSFYLEHPDRIVIDLPNTTLGSLINGQVPVQNGEIETDHPLVNSLRYSMYSDDPQTVRVVIDLIQPVSYHLIEKTDTNEIVVVLDVKTFKVVIDAGHGGKDPGAPGHSGKHEKYFVLALAEKVNALLENEPFIQTLMTRTDDTFIELSDRAKMANDWDADVFVSIHGNTFERPISGTETYYAHESSYNFASVMHNHTVEAAGLPDRNVRQVNYKVLRETVMPAALLEIGYLSNSSDESKMLSSEFQDRVAAGIVAGIKEYLGLNS